MRKYIRSEQGYQGGVHWNQAQEYDDEMARQMIIKDRPKTSLKDFSYRKEITRHNP